MLSSNLEYTGLAPSHLSSTRIMHRYVRRHSRLAFQRKSRWLSFFAEYNLEVKYKPGKRNVLVNSLSRQPDNELAQCHNLVVSSWRVNSYGIHRIINVRNCLMPSGVRSTKTRTPVFRHGCVPDYINIPSIMFPRAIAQMWRMPIALLCLTMRINLSYLLWGPL